MTQGAVHQWRSAGVPVARRLAVRDLTSGDVGLDDMLSDVERVAMMEWAREVWGVGACHQVDGCGGDGDGSRGGLVGYAATAGGDAK